MKQDDEETVFLSEGVKALLAAANALLASEDSPDGCDPRTLTVVDSASLEALRAAMATVAMHERRLVIGGYDHVHGNDTYLFALSPGDSFTQDDFVEFIESTGIDFEEDHEFVHLGEEKIIDLGGQESPAGSGVAPATRSAPSAPRVG